MNKTFHSVWNASKQAYVAAAETVSAKGKPSSGVKLAAVMASLMGSMLGTLAHGQTAPPPNTLPTGGQINAGQASISANGAHMVIQQSTGRAAIDWQTFNVGKDAHVQFQQPSAASVTLNRVMSSDPSQIFGRISANGQVVLTNPAGVYFGRDARVDVGGILATTHGISDADFMAGKSRYERKGATGSVVNEGEIKAALGGYIALLAPEVRNQGAVIAHMGTVALAAGEAVDLHFDSSNRLTSIRVEASQIAALVDNQHAVQAPGGLVIISAQSVDRLVGGVVKNSGRIEAHGLQQQGGRIILSASKRVENTGSISANATAGSTPADSGPAGKIEITAPEVTNSGSITTTGSAAHSGGSLQVQASHFTQSASGSIDLSAPTQGGQLSIQTTGNVNLQGSVNVEATQDHTPAGAATQGGQIDIVAQGDIELNNATLDASGGQGGSIALRAAADSQPDNPNPMPEPTDVPGQGRLAIMGHSTLSTRGRSAQGGSATVLGDHIHLLDTTAIDATGKTGGGTVLVGGDWQGGNGVYQATTLTVAEGVTLDASATSQGQGGKVVLWSTDVTDFAGQIASTGAGSGSSGGDAEVSGKAVLNYTGFANLLGSEGGQSGNLLLDPYNLYIVSGTGGSVTAGSIDSLLGVSTLVSQLSGANVTISTGSSGWQQGTVGLMTGLSTSSTNNLTINAAGNVVIAADVNMGGKLTINTGNSYDFLMGTNVSTASGVNITAHGGFEKTNTSGTSYLTGSITTTGTAITLNGNIQLASFNGSTIGLNSNGGNITLNSGTISRYDSNAYNYAYLTAYRLYNNPSINTLGSDILLTYTWDSGVFLGQQGMGSVQYLLVGGGGGGGAAGGVSFFSAGGGGGGQVKEGTTSASWGSANTVAVGAGGAGSSDRTVAGGIGGTSRLGGITAQGGGGGASGDANRQSENAKATAGFTGGGGGAHLNWGDQVYIGATGTGGANTKGGNGEHNGSYEQVQRAGGGGGAGGPGMPGSTNKYDELSAAGGVGVASSITGSTVTYGGGGGGGKRRPIEWYGVSAGDGRDGGGNGGANANGADAVFSRGGGGGGSGSDWGATKKGGDGGSGLVALRYTVGNTSATAGNSLSINAGAGAVSMSSYASSLSSLQISVGSASTVTGIISGSTSFTKGGVGALTLTQNNTYTGTNTINGGTLVLQNNAPNPSNKTFNGTGALRIEPSSTSFTSAFSTTGWTFNPTLIGLTLGKDGNTQAITVASAINIAGPIALYGGNLLINAGVTATGTNTITLKGGSSSSVSGTGFVNAGNLLLLGGGTITLNSTSNAIGTLAASGIGSLTYVDSDALNIGTLGTTNGVSATGTVSIGTRTGDLTLSRNVSTTRTSSTSAVVLNAGISAAAGTSTGGNLIVSGTPSVSVGSGSRATLYSGSITGSTGLANLSGLTAGTGRFRYNADETTTFSGTWTPLGTGLHAVYREQPTASLSSTTLTMTYGDLLPAISATGLVNGDVSTYTISGRLNSTSGNVRASADPYTITTDLLGLGYSAASGTGTLTVNQKALTLVDSVVASRVYNGNTSATITSVGSLVGRVGSDVVTVSSTGGTFDTKDVATGKTVTLGGISLASGNANNDADNYTIASTATTTASITPMALTVTASNANKTYDGLSYNGVLGVTYSAFAGAENATALSGSLAYNINSGQGAVDAGAYAITPSGLSSTNYTIQYKDGVLTVDPRQVAVTGLLASGKVYDGTNTATVTNWGTVGAVAGNANSGLVAGEGLTLNHGTAAFASKNVAYASNAVTSQTVTATGYSLADGTNGKASNYVLTSASATTTATITPLALNINGVSINDKVYDGNTTAVVNGGNISKLGSDAVSLVNTGATGTFASADVAYNGADVAAQSVAVSSFTLTGGDAGNYSLIQPTGLSATIQRKTVTLNSLSATSKTYDGTTSAPLSSTPTLSGVVTGESLGVSGTATYATADAGTGIVVTVAGLTLADGTGKASNYALSSPTATTTGTINRKVLTISEPNADDKTYDGTTNVNITDWGSVSTGVTVGALTETLTLNHGTASFSTKDVLRDESGDPIAKTVTATGYNLANGTAHAGFSAGKASNYSLSSTSATTTAIISPATLTVRANDDAKLVTTADPTFTLSYSGFVNGETASVLASAPTVSVNRSSAVDYTAPGSATSTTAVLGISGAETAGQYDGALFIASHSGAANNYTLNRVAGNYTIVPADTLLVKVKPVSTVYGTAPVYSATAANAGGVSASYLDSSAGPGSLQSGTLVAAGTVTVDAAKTLATYTSTTFTPVDGSKVVINGELRTISNADTTNKTFTVDTALSSTTGGDFAAVDTTSGLDSAFALTTSLASGSILKISNDYRTATVSSVAGAQNLTLNSALSSAVNSPSSYSLNTLITSFTPTISGSQISLVGPAGAADTAVAALTPTGALTSTSNNTRVGSYQLSAGSGSTTNFTNLNFNAMTVTGNLTVNQMAVTPTVTAGASKTYDGTTTMTGLTVSSPAFLSGDLVTLTTGGGVFASRNAGTHNYSVSNVALAGTTTPTVGDDSANYYVSNGTITGSGTISEATLTFDAVTDTKVYDGTTASSKAVVARGLMASDSISGLVQTFNSKSVTADTVEASGYTINDGNSGNNYTLTSNTAAGTISQAPLTLTAVTDTKVYDGTTNSNKSVRVSGLVAGDSIGGLSQSFLSKDVAAANTSDLRVNTGFTVKDAALADMLGNYAVTDLDTTTAAGTITPASLIVSGVTAANKTYNGNTDATINVVGNANLLGLISGDTVTFGNITGTFADKHAGNGKTVTFNNYTLTGDVGNYSITRQDTTTANITQKPLTVSATGVTKVYDGGTGMTNVSPTSDKLSGDVVNVSVIGSFGTAAAGKSKPYTLTVIGVSGDDARNYSLNIGSTFSGTDGEITQRPLTVTANNATKTYDGQAWSAGNGLSYSGEAGVPASGFASGEDASVLAGTVVWSGTAQSARNAGTYSMSPSGYSTSGNYAFTYVPGSLTIAPAALTLSAVSETKVYDATTTSLGTVLVSGLQVGDSISNLTQAYDSKAVGTGASRLNVVTGASGYVINDGNNSANYTVTLQAASGEITQRAIAIGGITASSKEYNGNDTAAVVSSGATGWIVGDSFSVNATGQFSDKHVGTDKVITLTSTYSGTDVGNYIITDQATTTADITPKSITITGVSAADKVYNGTNEVVVSVANATGWVVTDSFSVTADGSFVDRHVGTDKTVNLNVNYSGDDVGNYIVTVPATTTASITAKPVTLNAPTATRDYNGQTGYTATDAQMAALTSALGVTGDSVSGISLTFDNKNVGDNKQLIASNLVINDGNGGNNYAVQLFNNNQSSITQLSSVSWTGLGTTNAWFDPMNWFGGAVPDLANVATVVIPEGLTADFNTTGSYPAGVVTNQPVSLLGLQGAGTLSMTAGQLNLGNNGAVLAGYAQTGGSLSSTGSLNLTDSFSQTGGTLSTTGDAAHITISQMTGPVIESTIGTGAEEATILTKTTGPLSWFNVSSGGNLTVTASQIDFGQTTVEGNLLSTTTGAGALGGISQTAPMVIKGKAEFVAEGGLAQNASLMAANDFQGVVSFTEANNGSWLNVSLKDVDDITLGGINVGGNLVVDAGGNIQQDSSAGLKIVVGGETDLTVGGDITLDGPSNDFQGTVNADGGSITLSDENDIDLGDVTAGDDFKVTAGGDITQDSTDGKKIVVGGETDLTAGGDITLDGPSNDFQGTVNADGGNITLSDENDITLGDINGRKDDEGNGGNFTAQAGGDITQDNTDGKKIVVGGDTDLSASGDITLDGPSNDFQGTVNADGGSITLVDENDIDLGNVTAGDDFKVTAGGDITQDSTNGKKIVVGGETDLSASGDITLDGPSNDFQGTVNADGGSITLSDENDIDLGDVTAGDDFKVTAGGDITQDNTDGKKIVVGGDTDLSADGNITLDGPSNDFQGTVNADGGNITLRDENDISLGDINARKDDEGNGGNFTAQAGAGGDITQDNTDGKKIVVGGETDLTAGGDITLDGPSNDFQGTVNVEGKNITIQDENDLKMGDVVAEKNLDLRSDGNLELANTIVGEDFKAETSGGNLTQTDKLVVVGKTEINAGDGTVELTKQDNNMAGGVDIKARSLSIIGDKLGDAAAAAAAEAEAQAAAAKAAAAKAAAAKAAAEKAAAEKAAADKAATQKAEAEKAAADKVAAEKAAAEKAAAEKAAAEKAEEKAAAKKDAEEKAAEEARRNQSTSSLDAARRTEPVVPERDLLAQQASQPPSVVMPAADSAGQAARTLISSGQSSGAGQQGSNPGGGAAGASTSDVSSSKSSSSRGLSIDLIEKPTIGTAYNVNVAVPKEVVSAGQGFVFELPQSVKALAQPGNSVQASLTNGASLPAWLQFSAESMRFEAQNLPVGALPLEVMLMIGVERVLVVISQGDV